MRRKQPQGGWKIKQEEVPYHFGKQWNNKTKVACQMADPAYNDVLDDLGH